MTVAIGLGLILIASAIAAYPSVRRRQVRARTVSCVRASLAPWLTADLAAPLLPSAASGVDGPVTAGPCVFPRPHGPAVRQHFELTPHEIEHHRRAS